MRVKILARVFRAVFQQTTCLWIISGLSALVASTIPALSTAAENETLGLPSVPVPAVNPQTPAKIALGDKLFQDTRLSANGKVSCATCHRPDRAFADGRVVAKGIGDQEGTRNTPTLLNAAYFTSQFWDGRRASLEAQARDPFVNPVEHGLADHAEVLARIRADQEYVNAFREAFGVGPSGIDMDDVGQALASFERTLAAADSPFDRYHFGGDTQALTRKAARGFELFRGKAGCAACHAIGEDFALFTDNRFHSLGIGMERIAPRLTELARYAHRATPEELDRRIGRDKELAALGRFVVTRRAADIGKFRTPSLRNVALTAPYMHDGSVPTLEQAVEIEVYYRGIHSGRPLVLTVEERTELVAFLQSLTSSKLKQTQVDARFVR